MKEALIKTFIKTYGQDENEVLVFSAPGRVNLIGEHIDYNGGTVFPAALDLSVYMAVRRRSDLKISFKSLDYHNSFHLLNKGGFRFNQDNGWGNYPIGVLKMLKDFSDDIDSGFDVLFASELPVGAGLSSSAALEMVFGYGMTKLFNIDLNKIELALLCQRAENEFVGVACGIMDQFAVAMGKRDKGILLNTDTLDYKYEPFQLLDYKLVITNTNVKRGLIDSKYNQRLRECRAALERIRPYKSIQNLCSIHKDELNQVTGYLKDELLVRRVTHVVTENDRVIKGVEALKNDDLEAFGDLMKASHRSLRYDYEVTGSQLDTIFDAAVDFKGCIGSRMTGAGFGGCNISLVEEARVEAFKHFISGSYLDKTGILPSFYVCEIEEGVKEV